MKKIVLAAFVIAWIAGWGWMLHLSRQGFWRSEIGYWKAKSTGDEATALAYVQAQGYYRDWAHSSIALGIVLPLAILGVVGVLRLLRKSRDVTPHLEGNDAG